MVVLAALALFVVASILSIAYWYLSEPRNLPPGPPGLPLLGSTLKVLDVNEQQAFLFDCVEKYGPIFKLYIANKLVIILGDHESIQEAMVKQGEIFSGRPQLYSFMPTRCRHLGIIVSEGELWKEHRQFAMSTLRDLGVGRRVLEPRILEEVDYLCDGMIEFAATGKPFDPQRLVMCAISNIICQLMFGRRRSYDDEKFVRQVMSLAARFGSSSVSPLSPLVVSDKVASMMSWMPALKQVRAEIDELVDYIEDEIKETAESFDPDSEPNNYVHAYKKEALARPGSTYSEIQLLSACYDLFIGGTGSVSSTIRWAILLLCYHPEIQERMHKEIRDQVGSSLPGQADRSKMPYIDAVIMEIQRFVNLVPMGVTRRPLKATKLMGYDIPEDAIVAPFLTNVLHNPKLYPNPEKFDPMRFLGPDGSIIKDPNFIPFQTGKRLCLGAALARMELFLFIAGLVSKYRFYFPQGQPKPSLEPTVGIARVPKPFEVTVEFRDKFDREE